MQQEGKDSSIMMTVIQIESVTGNQVLHKALTMSIGSWPKSHPLLERGVTSDHLKLQVQKNHTQKKAEIEGYMGMSKLMIQMVFLIYKIVL